MLSESDLLRALADYGQRLTSGNYPWWVILAEMLLIGAVIYAVLRSLQGTRGARLLRAVGLILVVSFLIVRLVAQKYAFTRINFLYPYFLGGVFLMTLVAFQPELRRGLIRLGEIWGLSGWSKDAELLLSPLVKAVASLSKNKIGALIALEGRVPIGGLVESGVPLDAELSAELLETIFWPGSALHDLGVVVRQGRIAAAGCQFPLADSDDADRSLGSRHRAALGLSQECDALVIVVSEETGTISLAHRGRMRRQLAPDVLRRLLDETLDASIRVNEPGPPAHSPGKPAPRPSGAERSAPATPQTEAGSSATTSAKGK
ncbi:MAG: TIGR00159 family protein [bacterium]|nr:TIGR00159 family protein [bacterium]